ncbi:tripartite tricarboxylate transporter TctB family protein [uncultured Desulfovibrio sp.]|jgi:putative tricarboxylic transport membrane protein|uniref:tripartite tricarboxylate transporter TctB family protein n=1 Tax=uncultured Desulfovibrio sp. TaxID=167968 RepID=UPI00208B491A|nr:tripartite tricarboxylate transporter TctB family protein [uncultured Desulfovibrio sp.]GKG93934.1 hypothetical protein CE91St38_19420 [Desulfovibrionaceae bacterium]GKI12484.1 hypothetical protein CE91St39_19380 [Desulfovibrionaceae bacterium]
MRKSISDILCGASFLAISAAFGLQYEGLTGVSRVFPESLILIIAVGGLWFVGKGLYKRRGESPTDAEQVAWRKVGYIAAMAAVYAALIGTLGFFSSTALFIFCSSLLLGDKSRSLGHLAVVGLLYSLFFSLAVWFSFTKLLNVPTPAGFLF